MRQRRSVRLLKYPKLLALLAFSSALIGCGGGDAALRGRAQDLFLQGNFAQAEIETIQPDVIKESQNRLLTLLELGTFAHYQGLYEKSNIYFFRAKDVAKQLFTKSIREAMATGLLNDNSASYVGMEYELSLLHYYITANFLLLSQSDKAAAWQIPEIKDGKDVVFPAQQQGERPLSQRDRVEALTRARAELLAWNAYLREVRERNHGQPYYKDDLLNKVFAAYIHRLVGSIEDQNIARVLLRDAKEIMVRAYSAYPTFNAKSKDYVDNYENFEEIGEKGVKAKFIEKTPYYSGTETQIEQVAKHQGNTLFVLEHGIVPKRKEKSYVIGLSTLFRQISDPQLRRQVEQIGTQVFLELAPELGLTFVGASVVGATTGKGENGGDPQYISEAVDSAIGFQFKLPEIASEPIQSRYTIKYLREEDKKEFNAPVAMMNPLADIAKLNVDRRAGAIVFKTGVRVGLKYLAALVPAIYAYKKVDGPKMLKSLAATAVWMAGKKIVDATESADIRAWNLLPQWVGLAEASLPKGKYTVVAFRENDNHSFPIGKIQIDSETNRKVLKARILTDDHVANSPMANIIN